MKGYQIKFFTQENRKHEGKLIFNWLVDQARELGVRGATVQTGEEGFGHDGKFHAETFFDLEGRPIQVVMAMSPEEWDALFSRIKSSGANVFYTKTPIEFGFTQDE